MACDVLTNIGRTRKCVYNSQLCMVSITILIVVSMELKRHVACCILYTEIVQLKMKLPIAKNTPAYITIENRALQVMTMYDVMASNSM